FLGYLSPYGAWAGPLDGRVLDAPWRHAAGGATEPQALARLNTGTRPRGCGPRWTCQASETGGSALAAALLAGLVPGAQSLVAIIAHQRVQRISQPFAQPALGGYPCAHGLAVRQQF